jgi:hypothetical protein
LTPKPNTPQIGSLPQPGHLESQNESCCSLRSSPLQPIPARQFLPAVLPQAPTLTPHSPPTRVRPAFECTDFAPPCNRILRAKAAFWSARALLLRASRVLGPLPRVLWPCTTVLGRRSNAVHATDCARQTSPVEIGPRTLISRQPRLSKGKQRRRTIGPCPRARAGSASPPQSGQTSTRRRGVPARPPGGTAPRRPGGCSWRSRRGSGR